ncbi:glycosyltransferase [Pseudenhygromyxa sp. WMMC2535]|uniref:glycosyltransferase n=1 Tax=Pseudenhygromyxa sp. WMMC2535 TaxID=2712867 RepID=UPI0015550668|nr:glycosyltransferase [Pseudenhygromyxa sp. WMMC2535]NVB40159.1 glycosyltransferase [Pseudenhygromyxa sp. WMMC2535]
MGARQRTVLMISRYFPPMFDVGGKRAYRFARYLPEQGWRAAVLTGRVPERRPVDDAPLELPEGTRVERVYEPFWFREIGRRPSDGTVSTPVRSPAEPTQESPRRRLLGLPVGPDLAMLPHVVREATRLGREVEADVVWATSSPYATLVQGHQVARALGKPLVLDLRDPWTINFFQRRRARWALEVDRRVESRLFHAADKVILNCESALASYRELYPELPADRMLAIRNAFDPAQRPEPEPEHERGADAPIRLLHFGNCYGPRRLETVLRAMAAVRERRPQAPAVVLENLGRVGTADLELAASLGLSERFVHGVFVPYAEGLRRLAAADLAVLVAYGDETLYIPAKLYDYLLARAPVACLSQPGELADIVEGCGAGRAVRPGDVEGVATLIDAAIDARARNERAFTPDEDALASYGAPATTRALAGVFDELAR